MKYRSGRGFTLIELLTVIAIIAVVAAMLFPVYANAKKSAAKAQCVSNLAQIGKAFEAYISDYDSCYPNTETKCLWMGRYWRWPMKRYVGYNARYDSSDPRAQIQSTHVWNTILRCPADPTPGDIYDGTSYGYSASFFHTPDQLDRKSPAGLYDSSPVSFATIRTADVLHPSKKAMIADWLTHTDDHSSWWTSAGSRCYLFADGHVLYLSVDKIHKALDNSPDINRTKDGVAGKDID